MQVISCKLYQERTQDNYWEKMDSRLYICVYHYIAVYFKGDQGDTFPWIFWIHAFVWNTLVWCLSKWLHIAKDSCWETTTWVPGAPLRQGDPWGSLLPHSPSDTNSTPACWAQPLPDRPPLLQIVTGPTYRSQDDLNRVRTWSIWTFWCTDSSILIPILIPNQHG